MAKENEGQPVKTDETVIIPELEDIPKPEKAGDIPGGDVPQNPNDFPGNELEDETGIPGRPSN